jgi:hypothetical protein
LPQVSSPDIVETMVRVRILALIDYIWTLREGSR